MSLTVGAFVVVKKSFVNDSLNYQNASPNLNQTLQALGTLGTLPLQILALGTFGPYQTITVVPLITSNPMYNSGNGVVLYFNNSNDLSNSFDLSTAFLDEIEQIRVFNNTISTIPRGSVVYYTTFNLTQQMPNIGLASAASQNTATSIGLTDADIPANQAGSITTVGGFSRLDTSSFSTVNDFVFLSDTFGAISSAPGTHVAIVGRITSIDSINGSMFVYGWWSVAGATGIGSGGGSGSTGLRGATGIQGNTGVFAGVTGLTGTTGLIGSTGIQPDFQGTTGVQGNTGVFAGVTGLMGATGIRGTTGVFAGVTGLIGNTGLIGSTGIQPDFQGTTGVQGNTGVFAGVTGLMGTTGLALGSTGIQGVTGVGGGSSPALSAVLAVGNTTGGNNIVISSGDSITAPGVLPIFSTGNIAVKSIGATSTAQFGVQGSGDVSIVQNGTFVGTFSQTIYPGFHLLTSIGIGGDAVLQASGVENATNAITPWPYLATCNGTPDGVPGGGLTGTAAVAVDRSGNKFWAYYDGAWHNLSNGAGVIITSYTGDTSLNASPAQQYSNNTGASGEVKLTLPTAVSGMSFIFYTTVAQFLRVVANTGASIYLGISNSAASGFVRSNAVGSAVRLVAQSSTVWIAESVTGTWTIDS